MTAEKPPPRELRPTGALLLLIIHGAGFLVLLALGQLVLEEDQISLVFVLAARVLSALIALYVGLVRYAPAESTWAALRFVKPDRRGWGILGLGVVFGACAAPVIHAVGSALAVAPTAEELDAVQTLLAAPGAALALDVATVLVIPFVEEALYRGFMQPRLVKLVGVVRGIALTLLFYTAASASASMLLVLVVAAPLGILAHAGATTWAPLASRVALIATLLMLDIAPDRPRLWVVIICGAAAAGVLALIWRGRRPR